MQISIFLRKLLKAVNHLRKKVHSQVFYWFLNFPLSNFNVIICFIERKKPEPVSEFIQPKQHQTVESSIEYVLNAAFEVDICELFASKS